MLPYPKELRERALAACDAGDSTKAVADRFNVSRAWVRRLKQRRRETGETLPRPSGGRRFAEVDRARLAELVREHPDARIDELRDRLGVRCSPSAICMALKKLGITLEES